MSGGGGGSKESENGLHISLGVICGFNFNLQAGLSDYAQGLGHVQSTTPGWGCSMSSTFRKIVLAGFCIGEN